MVAFALETEDQRMRALPEARTEELRPDGPQRPEAMHSLDTEVEVIDKQGQAVAAFRGGKEEVSREIVREIQSRLIERGTRNAERGA